MKRELRKKFKDITQLKSIYKERAVPAGNEKSRSSSGYNNFFDKNKDKDFKKKKRYLPFHDLKLKIRFYRIYLFHALFFRAIFKLIFRNLGKTLPIRSLRYRIFF
jgi:hypothetical protein